MDGEVLPQPGKRLLASAAGLFHDILKSGACVAVEAHSSHLQSGLRVDVPPGGGLRRFQEILA